MYTKRMFKSIPALTFVFLFCFYQNCFAVLNLPPPPNVGDSKKVISEEELKRLALAISYIKQYYVKKVDSKTLMDNALSGMLAKLDPHSDYLDESDLKDLELVTVGHFGGVGIEVVPDQGAIRVVSPLDDSPAAKVGIKAGDLIIQIDNKFVKDMTLRNAISMMRGPKGTTLKLTILRKNIGKPLIFKVKRDTIKVKTVKERFLEPNYAYIRLAFFQETTAKELEQAIERLKKKNKGDLRGIILDLRNNPGGLLESAVQVADDFLDANYLKNNKLIVYTEGQYEGSRITAKATQGDLLENVPIVVLINEGSASAAEIVAGALQDHKRAVIVGERSFGKGSVQTLLPLDEHSAIKLTTALYYTPNGRSIQAKGIEPDITIGELKLTKNTDAASLLHIDESKLVDHLANGNQDQNSEEADENGTANESGQILDEKNRIEKSLALAHSDYQLYEALTILKSLNVLPKH